MVTEDSDFPQINKTSLTGESGVTIVKSLVENEFGWLFRPNHLEHDFGIDAYIDVITDKGQVTGKSIAIQIKTGISFFHEENEIGFVYRGEMKHLNYYLNLEVPLVIIIVNNIQRTAYWCAFEANITDKAGKSWKITIPKKQKLNKTAKMELLKHVNPITDYASQLENFWEFNKLLNSDKNRLLFRVSKEDVVNKNCDFILKGLERIQSTSDLILNLKGSVDISFDDYDNDQRELDEIPEVKRWISKIFKLSNCWPYLMTMDKASGFMKLLFYVHVPITRAKDYSISYSPKDSMPFIKELFNKLNEYCEKNGLSEKTNHELTDKIVFYFTDGKIDFTNGGSLIK